MNTSKFRFTLDLQSIQSQISIPVTRGDTARTWEISFSDGNRPFILGEGILAKLEIKRPTGTYMEEFCAIENETNVRYSFSQNENTAAVEGVHACALILYGADGELIGSPRFTMIVSERVISADDINLSDSNLSAIDAMIAAEAARQSAEVGRVNAEASRQSAESAREQTAEQMRNILAQNRFLPEIGTGDEGKLLGVSGGRYALVFAGTGGVTVAEYDGEVVIA